MSDYEKNINANRTRKDQFFFSGHPQSPIAPEDQSAGHLNYWPPNKDYVFNVKVKKTKEKETIKIPATGGEMRLYNVYGTFDVKINGQKVTFTIYENDKHLFLPIRDATAGKDSYGAGRYLDVEEQNGHISVDFNLLYAPFCAYNDNYSCPLVPDANRVDVRIEAGEKVFPRHD